MSNSTSDHARAMARARWARDKLPIEDRFWSKVQKTDGEGCWLWTASKNYAGYGRFGLEHTQHGKTAKIITASRMAWILTYGPIPQGRSVLHKCDNPPCVRPDHLFIGTIKENQQDMARKGRTPKPKAKITLELVRQIREEYRTRYYYGIQAELAKKYGLGRPQINNIVHGRMWKET